jgi:DNA polymerase I (EC 2.7.7.7)
MVGLSFAISPHEAWYVPVPQNPTEARALLNEFKEVFENEQIAK